MHTLCPSSLSIPGDVRALLCEISADVLTSSCITFFPLFCISLMFWLAARIAEIRHLYHTKLQGDSQFWQVIYHWHLFMLMQVLSSPPRNNFHLTPEKSFLNITTSRRWRASSEQWFPTRKWFCFCFVKPVKKK